MFGDVVPMYLRPFSLVEAETVIIWYLLSEEQVGALPINITGIFQYFLYSTESIYIHACT